MLYLLPKTYSDYPELWFADVTTRWNFVPEDGGAMATGLGLLLSGGYLTQKGAAVLTCPSENPDDETAYLDPPGAWGGWQPAQADQGFQYDPTEPFFTSGGKFLSANGVSYPNPNAVNNTGIWRLDSTYGNNAGDDYNLRYCNRGSHGTYYNGTGFGCTILGSYELRAPALDTKCYYPATTMSRYQGKAVVSDAIYNWVAGPLSYGGGSVNWSYYQYPTIADHSWDYDNRYMWFANHDSYFNVLFTDGSVKGFSDAGQSLRKKCIEIGAANRYAGGSSQLICTIDMGQKTKNLWMVYFDPLYAQD